MRMSFCNFRSIPFIAREKRVVFFGFFTQLTAMNAIAKAGGIGALLVCLTLLATAQAQPPSSSSAKPGASPIETLKAQKRERVKAADESIGGFVDKKDLEACWDRMIAAVEKGVPSPHNYEAELAMGLAVLGDLNEVPPTFIAAALSSDPDGGQVYIVGRWLEGLPNGFNRTHLIPMTEILFAEINPKAEEAYQKHLGRTLVPAKVRNPRTEQWLESILVIMEIENPQVLEEGKALLEDRAKLQAWLLERTKDANFGGEANIEREYKAFLRKKS